MFALKNLALELRPISTVLAFLDSYHVVIHLKDWTVNLVSLRSCTERFNRAQELQLRLGFRMLSTAFFITLGPKSFEIARLRVRFDYVVRVIGKRESQYHASGCKTLGSRLYCVESATSPKAIPGHRRRSVCINAGHGAPNLISVHSMNRNIFYIIGVIVVIVIVLKLLGLF